MEPRSKNVSLRNTGEKLQGKIVFAATSSGLTRRTEWTYLHGVKATATYEAGKRRPEISGPKQATSVFETSGKPVHGGWESVTASLFGPRTAVLGNSTISPGSTVGIVVPLYDKSYTTKRDDGTTELGGSRTGTTNSVTNPGSTPGATKTGTSYDVYEHFGEAGATKVGEGSSSFEYDPSTGQSHGETFESSPDGTRTSSSTDTDGHGGITTSTKVTEKGADWGTTTYESTETTNPMAADREPLRPPIPMAQRRSRKSPRTVTAIPKPPPRRTTRTGRRPVRMIRAMTMTILPITPTMAARTRTPMGPADVAFTGYLNNVNAYLGGNSLSQGAFTALGDAPPFDAIAAAMVSEAGGQSGQVLASSVAVLQADDPDLNPRALVGAMGRLSVLRTQGATFLAATKVASVLGPVRV